jgi:hypothetical protein
MITKIKDKDKVYTYDYDVLTVRLYGNNRKNLTEIAKRENVTLNTAVNICIKKYI